MSEHDDSSETIDPRGVLYPARLPTFHREPSPEELGGLVRWFWIPRWRLAAGRTSRQELLPFPASNLVVAWDGVTLSGPSSRASHRDLRGTGWAVGMLLRPAALPSLGVEPESIRDAEVVFDAPGLLQTVSTAMADPDEATGRRLAVAACARWCTRHLRTPEGDGVLANAMEELVAADRTIVRVEQLAEALGVTTRAVQRLAKRYIGLTPLAVIRRYRLQEAAQRLRDEPDVTISQVAAELGYADHAHLSGDFRTVLGFTANDYRRDPDARTSS